MITQTFDLNLIPNSAPVVIHVDQYDHGEGRLIAKLYNGSPAYTPAAGATAIIQGKKPDGHGFMYDATLSGNTVTADLTNQMSVVAGRVFVQFVITESDNRTGTFVFFLDVQPSALPADTEMSTSEYQVIEELLETAQAINENFPYIGANGHWFYYDVEQGQYVDSGVAAGTSITVGTTTTLDAGDDATVTNSGDNVNAVFNFGIPRGPKGDQGNPGATGPQGPQGPQGEQGEKGDTGNTGATPNITMSATVDGTSSATPTVNVSKTGTTENPDFALAFSGLKGNQGEQGPQGETGATGATGNGIASITKTGTAGLVDTYTILFTNGQTTTFTVTNGQDGTGSGDMTKAVYDSTNAVADAGGIVNYIDGLNFDKYLAVYGQTAISGADLDQIITLGSYRKTGTGLKSGSPSDIVSADEYVLIVVGAMADKEFDTESIDPAAQLMIAHIAATNETKVYVRGFAGFTGIGVLTPHWTTWKSLDSPDVSGKADKVSGATNGDFAGLDSNGNLTDSGYKASDFATASSVTAIEGKIPSTASSSNKMATASDITDVYEVMGENGAKNLVKTTTNTTTVGGLTFTRNSDGTYTIGAGTANADIRLNLNTTRDMINWLKAYKGKNVKLSGAPAECDNTYNLLSFTGLEADGIGINDIGSGNTATISNSIETFSYVYIRIWVKSGTVIPTDRTFKPMITLAEDTSSDYDHYQPYAMTNRELTDVIKYLSGSLTPQINTGGIGTITNGYIRWAKWGHLVFISTDTLIVQLTEATSGIFALTLPFTPALDGAGVYLYVRDALFSSTTPIFNKTTGCIQFINNTSGSSIRGSDLGTTTDYIFNIKGTYITNE